MDVMPDLAALRRDIDALDADLRALLRARAQLVSKVAASKAQSGAAGALRPVREAQQMAALLAWQRTDGSDLTKAGLVAIWREIISMALAQQGGLTIYATEASMMAARTYFGASLDYVGTDAASALRACEGDAKAVAVLHLDEVQAPPRNAQVFARLPVFGAPTCLCYGQTDVPPRDDALNNDALALVQRDVARDGDRVLARLPDSVLVETKQPENDLIWGHYLPLEAADA